MSIFRSLQSSLLPRWGEAPAVSVTLSEVPALEVEDLIDIQFRPDSRQEDELEGRLQAVLQAQDCDPLLGGEIALAFLQTVERYYESWVPDENALRDTRTALARALRSGLTRPPSRCQILGCGSGHPASLLRFAAGVAHALPMQLVSRGQADASRASEQAPPDAAVLRVLKILLRSHHNRTLLQHVGACIALEAAVEQASARFLEASEDFVGADMLCHAIEALRAFDEGAALYERPRGAASNGVALACAESPGSRRVSEHSSRGGDPPGGKSPRGGPASSARAHAPSPSPPLQRLLAPGAFSRLLARIAMRCFRLLSGGAGERGGAEGEARRARAESWTGLLTRLLAACLGAIEAGYWAPLDAGSVSVFRAEQPAARDVALQLLGLLASGPVLPDACLESLVLAVGAAARCPWAAGDMLEGGLEQTLADFLGFVGTERRVEREEAEGECRTTFTLSRLMVLLEAWVAPLPAASLPGRQASCWEETLGEGTLQDLEHFELCGPLSAVLRAMVEAGRASTAADAELHRSLLAFLQDLFAPREASVPALLAARRACLLRAGGWAPWAVSRWVAGVERALPQPEDGVLGALGGVLAADWVPDPAPEAACFLQLLAKGSGVEDASRVEDASEDAGHCSTTTQTSLESPLSLQAHELRLAIAAAKILKSLLVAEAADERLSPLDSSSPASEPSGSVHAAVAQAQGIDVVCGTLEALVAALPTAGGSPPSSVPELAPAALESSACPALLALLCTLLRLSPVAARRGAGRPALAPALCALLRRSAAAGRAAEALQAVLLVPAVAPEDVAAKRALFRCLVDALAGFSRADAAGVAGAGLGGEICSSGPFPHACAREEASRGSLEDGALSFPLSALLALIEAAASTAPSQHRPLLRRAGAPAAALAALDRLSAAARRRRRAAGAPAPALDACAVAALRALRALGWEPRAERAGRALARLARCAPPSRAQLRAAMELAVGGGVAAGEGAAGEAAAGEGATGEGATERLAADLHRPSAQGHVLFWSLMRWAEELDQVWGLDAYASLLKRCPALLPAASASRTCRVLLRWLASLRGGRPALRRALLAPLRALCACAASASDAREALRMLRPGSESEASVELLEVLAEACCAPRGAGPRAWLAFAGPSAEEEDAHEAGEGGAARFAPHSLERTRKLSSLSPHGYSLAAWVCARPPGKPASPAEEAVQVLVSLTTGEPDCGAALALHWPRPSADSPPRACLALHTWSPQHSVAVIRSAFVLPGAWTHVAASHAPGGPLSAPAARFFCQGQAVGSGKVRYPPTRGAGREAQSRPVGLALGALRLENGGLHAASADALLEAEARPFQGWLGDVLILQEAAGAPFLRELADAGPRRPVASLLAAAPGPAPPPPTCLCAVEPGTFLRELAWSGDWRAGEAVRVDVSSGLGDALHCLGGLPSLAPLLLDLAGRGGEDGDGVEREGTPHEAADTSPSTMLGRRAAALLSLLCGLVQQDPAHAHAFASQLGGFPALRAALIAAGAGAATPALLAACGAAARRLPPALAGALRACVERDALGLWRRAAPEDQLAWIGWASEAAGGGGGGEAAQAQPVSVCALADVLRRQGCAAGQAQADADKASLRRAYLALARVCLAAQAEQAATGSAEGVRLFRSGQLVVEAHDNSGSPSRALALGAPLQVELAALVSLLLACVSASEKEGKREGPEGRVAGPPPPHAPLPLAGSATAAAADLARTLAALFRRESMARAPLLGALAALGGPGAFLPLLRARSLRLRVHGARLLAATLDVAPEQESRALVRSACALLAASGPLPSALRAAALELLCGGLPLEHLRSALRGTHGSRGNLRGSGGAGRGLEDEDRGSRDVRIFQRWDDWDAASAASPVGDKVSSQPLPPPMMVHPDALALLLRDCAFACRRRTARAWANAAEVAEAVLRLLDGAEANRELCLRVPGWALLLLDVCVLASEGEEAEEDAQGAASLPGPCTPGPEWAGETAPLLPWEASAESQLELASLGHERAFRESSRTLLSAPSDASSAQHGSRLLPLTPRSSAAPEDPRRAGAPLPCRRLEAGRAAAQSLGRMLCHATLGRARGWESAEQVFCALRALSHAPVRLVDARGRAVGAWAFAQETLCALLKDVVAAHEADPQAPRAGPGAGEEPWAAASRWVTEPFVSNAAALAGLVEDALSGRLGPRGEEEELEAVRRDAPGDAEADLPGFSTLELREVEEACALELPDLSRRAWEQWVPLPDRAPAPALAQAAWRFACVLGSHAASAAALAGAAEGPCSLDRGEEEEGAGGASMGAVESDAFIGAWMSTVPPSRFPPPLPPPALASLPPLRPARLTLRLLLCALAHGDPRSVQAQILPSLGVLVRAGALGPLRPGDARRGWAHPLRLLGALLAELQRPGARLHGRAVEPDVADLAKAAGGVLERGAAGLERDGWPAPPPLGERELRLALGQERALDEFLRAGYAAQARTLGGWVLLDVAKAGGEAMGAEFSARAPPYALLPHGHRLACTWVRELERHLTQGEERSDEGLSSRPFSDAPLSLLSPSSPLTPWTRAWTRGAPDLALAATSAAAVRRLREADLSRRRTAWLLSQESARAGLRLLRACGDAQAALGGGLWARPRRGAREVYVRRVPTESAREMTGPAGERGGMLQGGRETTRLAGSGGGRSGSARAPPPGDSQWALGSLEDGSRRRLRLVRRPRAKRYLDGEGGGVGGVGGEEDAPQVGNEDAPPGGAAPESSRQASEPAPLAPAPSGGCPSTPDAGSLSSALLSALRVVEQGRSGEKGRFEKAEEAEDGGKEGVVAGEAPPCLEEEGSAEALAALRHLRQSRLSLSWPPSPQPASLQRAPARRSFPSSPRKGEDAETKPAALAEGKPASPVKQRAALLAAALALAGAREEVERREDAAAPSAPKSGPVPLQGQAPDSTQESEDEEANCALAWVQPWVDAGACEAPAPQQEPARWEGYALPEEGGHASAPRTALTPPPPGTFGAGEATPALWVRPGGARRGWLYLGADTLVFVSREAAVELWHEEGGAGVSAPIPAPFPGPFPAAPAAPSSSQRIWRWELDAFHELHYARYLLQPTALELCHARRAGHLLLSFGSARARRDWVASLVQRRPRLQVFDRARKQAWAAALAQRWARRGMSTFDYLMALNTLAGRSYCDLDQYPVFPWVLRDFESSELDLDDPASFRDLSKPIGALNPDQLEFFRARYESLKRDRDLPPFFYGTHYSSAGIVLFYLLRLAPFTRLARQLQGGKFDHADRLFQSVAGAWHSCTHHSSDVKELVPEFFCQPEFLRNAGGHVLGVRQDGAALGDVELPPWAGGSPEEFVRLHRRALESEAVSRNLHLWVDLIFGWRQRGRPAEEACNSFFYLTYEGAVDLEALTDPMQRAAVEDQIRHFGQTPIQLFRRRHPARGDPLGPQPWPLAPAPQAHRPAAAWVSPAGAAPVVCMMLLGSHLACVHADAQVRLLRFPTVRASSRTSFSYVPAGAHNVLVEEPHSAFALQLGDAEGAWGEGAQTRLSPPHASSKAAKQPRRARPPALHVAGLPLWSAVLSAGHPDGSIRCHAVPRGRLLRAAPAHLGPATCLAVSAEGAVALSGGRDARVCVWRLASPPGGGGAAGASAYQNAPFAPPLAALLTEGEAAGGMPGQAARWEHGAESRTSPAALHSLHTLPLEARPWRVLHGHRAPVTCCAASLTLDAGVSAGADGRMLVHWLSTGQPSHCIRLPGNSPATALALLPESPCLVAHTRADLGLHLLTMEGRWVAGGGGFERLSCLAPAAEGRQLLTGGRGGGLTLRSALSLAREGRWESGAGGVTALAVLPGGVWAAAFADGGVRLFAPAAKA